MICVSHFLGHGNLCAISTARVNEPVIISHRHHHRLRRHYLNFAQLMMLISSLGLDNSELPGKAKVFAFIFSTPRACFLKFLLAQQSRFWITFVDTSASITLRWKASDPYASTTTGITFVLSPRILELLSQGLDIFQLSQLPFFSPVNPLLLANL